MQIEKKVFMSMLKVIKEDKQNILYLLYYSMIEAVLVLSIPLASSFVVNSVLAHASISVLVLGIVVGTAFIITTLLQVVKEYIIENFQQKIFIKSAIYIARMATQLKETTEDTKEMIDKYMNYFFDITAIQKLFPILLLDGTALFVKMVMSLLLLFIFDPLLFAMGLFFFVLFVVLLFLLGHKGITYAIERSDAKHDAIYFLQGIPYKKGSKEEVLERFDNHLSGFVDARKKIFNVIIRQLSLTFVVEGLIFTTFLIAGGYLVIKGTLPIGEFVAAEIIVVTITYTLKGFMKQLDYIYDTIEGFYKVDKLSTSLHEHKHD